MDDQRIARHGDCSSDIRDQRELGTVEIVSYCDLPFLPLRG